MATQRSNSGRRRWMSSRSSSCLLLLLLLQLLQLLFCCQSSAGLRSSHPLHAAVDRVNELGPFVGLVMSYRPEAEALRSSGAFAATSAPVDLYGRRFHVGRIRDVDVIYVLSGQRRLNAGITVQILLDVFDVWGIVHYGIAGSTNNSLSFGDVSIPKSLAFTGSWTWTKFHTLKESSQLSFRNYNIPAEGGNLLSGLLFKTEEFYSTGKPMEEVFWLTINSSWLKISEQLKVELQRCINETYCLPKAPEIVCGLKASTADVFVDNAAYRDFLFQEFGVSTVDEESAAVVMTAMSPGVPVIVIRGVSDLAGGENSWSSTLLSELASVNSVKVTVEFIAAIGSERSAAFGGKQIRR